MTDVEDREQKTNQRIEVVVKAAISIIAIEVIAEGKTEDKNSDSPSHSSKRDQVIL